MRKAGGEEARPPREVGAWTGTPGDRTGSAGQVREHLREAATVQVGDLQLAVDERWKEMMCKSLGTEYNILTGRIPGPRCFLAKYQHYIMSHHSATNHKNPYCTSSCPSHPVLTDDPVSLCRPCLASPQHRRGHCGEEPPGSQGLWQRGPTQAA